MRADGTHDLAIEDGKTELDRLRSSPRDDLSSRLQLAKVLLERGFDDEALEEFACLWESSLEISPSWVGVRGSFLIQAVRPLVHRSAEARRRFTAYRDALERRLTERNGVQDWFTLNGLLAEEERFLPWLKQLDQDLADELLLLRNHRLLELVERFDCWSDFARLVSDPVQLLREEHETTTALLESSSDASPEEQTIARSHFTRSLREKARALCRAMRAAGRDGEANAIAAEATKLDPSAEMFAAVE